MILIFAILILAYFIIRDMMKNIDHTPSTSEKYEILSRSTSTYVHDESPNGYYSDVVYDENPPIPSYKPMYSKDFNATLDNAPYETIL